ncbi:MAG: phage major capsid protein [Halioglobus sp.]|nr:phage major capsid protein [Halioglobus sp.]|tara:strand:- start:1611 stop:2864 length:1254 start_codon:yes stop_codon:yes gene_type:complete
MLESVKIQKRQSEIRQELAVLAGKETPEETEVRSMADLDSEYQTNETRYRAALIAEDTERREAGEELEERSEKEYAELVDGFELRQVADFLDDGSALSGQTAEVVQEMRSQGSYQGVPVPLAALEVRAGETIASGTPDPKTTRNVIDQLFPASVMSQMGGQLVNISSGLHEWPVVTQGASTGWAATETGDVGSAQAFQTTDKSLSPDNTLGCQMTLTRKAMKQSGPAMEQAVRRDMNSAISAALDHAAFLGTGASGEPLGVVQGASTYGITETALDASVTYALLRAVATNFMVSNAATSYKQVSMLMRHEVLDDLDDAVLSGTAVTDLDRIASKLAKVLTTSNALAAPAGSPLETKAVMTTSAGGVAPFFVGIWGGVDLIRDPYTKAASGQLALTGLVTADVTVARPAQLHVITDIQ